VVDIERYSSAHGRQNLSTNEETATCIHNDTSLLPDICYHFLETNLVSRRGIDDHCVVLWCVRKTNTVRYVLVETSDL